MFDSLCPMNRPHCCRSLQLRARSIEMSTDRTYGMHVSDIHSATSAATSTTTDQWCHSSSSLLFDGYHNDDHNGDGEYLHSHSAPFPVLHSAASRRMPPPLVVVVLLARLNISDVNLSSGWNARQHSSALNVHLPSLSVFGHVRNAQCYFRVINP